MFGDYVFRAGGFLGPCCGDVTPMSPLEDTVLMLVNSTIGYHVMAMK